MKVCVTGSCGFIGSHLVEHLMNQDEITEIIGFDNMSNGRFKFNHPKVKYVEGSVTRPIELDNAVKGCNILFHLAALPRVQYSMEHPEETHKVNVDGTMNVIMACHRNKVKKIVFASSSSVYGEPSIIPTNEKCSIDPMSPYAMHKAVCEIYLKLFSKLFKIDTAILRIFNAYGTRSDPTSEYSLVVPKFIHKIKNKFPIEVYGDGEQARDMSYVKDIVNAMYKSVKLKGCNILNIGNNQPIKINQIIEILKQKMQPFRVIYSEARKGEPRITHADITKAKRLLDWEPKISLNEGIQYCLDDVV